jgi:hypothetical protein
LSEALDNAGYVRMSDPTREWCLGVVMRSPVAVNGGWVVPCEQFERLAAPETSLEREVFGV